ncbi:MAG: group III truncated hemoglobin [Gemmatimonadota bacterium]|nr:group III truncated hemoglobin [Gemmatimonadota bacterium]
MRNVRDGVTEPRIRAMVETFYERIREDEALGPIFESHIGGTWPEHMDRMVDFWSSVLLGTARFRGNPAARHHAMAELRPEHFDRWLELFEEVLGEIFAEPDATDILWRARRMRHVLDTGSSQDATSSHLTALSTTRATR